MAADTPPFSGSHPLLGKHAHALGPRAQVLGAGLAGLMCAAALNARGWQVQVSDAAYPGARASGAAAGMLGPVSEFAAFAESDPHLTDFGCEAARLWPGYAAALQAISGTKIGFRQNGAAFLCASLDAAQAIAARAHALGLEAVPLDRAGLVAREPALAREGGPGLWIPQEAQIEPQRAVAALCAHLKRRGVAVRAGLTGVAVEPGAPQRVTFEDRSGVRTTAQSEVVIITTGLSAGVQIVGDATSGARLARALKPIKGQMAALEGVEEGPGGGPRAIVRAGAVYVAPKSGGRVFVGATVEEGHADISVEPAALAPLLDGARAAVPGLRAARVRAAWAGVRPGVADGLPILDRLAPGVVIATGLGRHGVLLAPAVAAEVAALLEAPDRPAPEPFRLQRFAA